MEELEHEVLREAGSFDGLRIIGPNCLGIIAPHAALNASFASGMPDKGHVAFISQSGALCTSVLDWALKEKIGFSHFVSVGNTLDVSIGDLIDYFANDGKTESIILYVESINEAREFMSAARAFARKKPIIAYKAGRFAQSAQAAASHTGAMAGVDTVSRAAFRRAGIIRVFEMVDMFDCAELLARQKPPKGPQLAIVTNAGGPGVMATDALLEQNGVLAKFSDTTLEKLDQHLPAAWSHSNPVDVLGDATPERLAKALETVLADKGVDAALVLFAPQAMSKPTDAAKAVIEAAKKSRKPVLTSWMGGLTMDKAVDLFNGAGIPTYSAPEQAVRAFMYLVSYARRREVLYETPRNIPVEFPLDRNKLRAVFNTILSEGHDVLTESASKALLEAYEIPVAKPYVARCPADAVTLARRLGYPVALKVMSPQINRQDGCRRRAAKPRQRRRGSPRHRANRRHGKGKAADSASRRCHRAKDGQQSSRPRVDCRRTARSNFRRSCWWRGGTAAELFQDRALGVAATQRTAGSADVGSLRRGPCCRVTGAVLLPTSIA